MSTLILALAAGLVLGNAPDAVSAEVEPPLDLSGEWAGTWCFHDTVAWRLFRATVRDGKLQGRRGKVALGMDPFVAEEDGPGKCQVVTTRRVVLWGIYKWEGEDLVLCLGNPRPTSFQPEKGQELFRLRRVRLSK